MGFPKEIYDRAAAVLAERRQRAREQSQRHRQEIYRLLPQIEQIDSQLRQVGMKTIQAVAGAPDNLEQIIERLKTQSLALQKQRDDLLEAAGLLEIYRDDGYTCKKCRDTGYVGAQMCSCLRELCRQEQKKELTSLLGSGRETFENFRLDLYPAEYSESVRTSPRALMQRNFNHCRKYAQNFTMQSGNMLFSGATGLGKTFLSACIARTVADRGYSVVYDTAIHLFSDFEAEKFGMSQEENRGLSQRYLQCDLLIIDDLGTEMTTQFVCSALYHVVNTRLMESRPTIISTNLTPEQLSVRYSPQIASRLLGTYRLIQFVGQDIRRL